VTGRRGFTLIELLVVLAVVGLLVSLALPRYFGNVERSKEAVLKENLHQMREAIQHYYADKGKYPEKLEALAEHKYLRRIPVDPVTEKADTWIVVAPADNREAGVYDIKSGAEGRNRDGVPYAEF
jgi:general secretion pathway protein G